MVRIRRHALVVTAVVLAAAGWAALPIGRGAGDQATAATTPPSLVTIKIPRTAFFGSSYQPATVTLAQGGTLRVRNRDNERHSVTSNRGYFSTTVLPGHVATVSGVSRLPAGKYGFHCIFHTSMKGTLIIKGSGGSLPSADLYKQPLKLPPVLTKADITLPIKKTAVRVLPNGPLTNMWTYGNSYPGPTIRRPTGGDTKVTFVDKLPKADGSFTVHLHGDHHRSADDGQPTTHLIRPGTSRTYDYPLTDGGVDERGSTFIYHDHRMMLTGRNVWNGQEGMFIVTDPTREAGLNLPTGKYDVPLLISDRSFTSDNQLTNPFASEQRPPNDATVGSKVLVDGRYAPYFNVDTHRYRLRIVNGSNFQSYNFKLSDGRRFTQIGSGDGLLPAPVKRSTILLGPFERADVVVNFAGELGKKIVLKSVPRTDTRPAGSVDAPSVPIMQFRVTTSVTVNTPAPPPVLEPAPTLDATSGISKTWKIGLDKTHHHWTINGHPFSPSRISDTVTLGHTEEWKIVNNTHVTHYIHLHEEAWQTIRRDGAQPPPWELGIQDTWKLDPGESIVVKGHFTDYTGLFMIHCHMLDHEDHGLMAQFDVKRPVAPAVSAPFTRVHRAVSAHHSAMNMAMTMPMHTHSEHAPAPSVASPGGSSFVKKFVVRLILLLVLMSAVWLLRSGRTVRGVPSPE